MGTWDDLSLSEKSEMMEVAIRNGITNLSDIKAKYNEFAEGGNLFKKGGPVDDNDLIDWIIKEEGFNKKPENIGDGKITLGSGLTNSKWHALYKKRGNKWSAEDNRMAVAEEVANRRRWAEANIPNWDTLPSSAQKALISYKYNYNFTKANSPKLFQALADSDLREAARQIDATSKDPKFKRGLSERRKREQEWFLRDVTTPQITVPEYTSIPVSTAIYNPYVQQVENTQVLPVMEPSPNSYIETVPVSPEEQRRRKVKEKFDAINRFNNLMTLVGIQNNLPSPYIPNTGNSLLDTIGMIYGNQQSDGGPIIHAANMYGVSNQKNSK